MKLIDNICLLFAIGISCVLCSCISVKFTRVNSWTEPDIQSKSGILTIPEETGLSFEYSNENLPLARGVLSTDGYSKDIVILFDTGMDGSYFDEKLIPFFTDIQDTGTKFVAQSVASTMIKGNGYRFSSLSIGSALIENPLLCSMDMSGVQISTVDGEKIGCVIGMNILSKMPFLFSNSQQKLFFCNPEKLDFLSEYTKIETVNVDNYFRLYVIVSQYDKELPFILDTGSPICYLDSGFIKRVVLPKTSLYRYRKNNTGKQVEGLFEKFCFFSYDNESILFLENLRKENTLGFSMLKKFDFFIDTHNNSVFFKRLSDSNSDTYRQDERAFFRRQLNPTFGFSLCDDGSRRFVYDIYLDKNKKQYVPDIRMNDELLSVNGITLDKFDWSIWYSLDEADFTFRRNKKEFSLHLKRQGIEGL